MANNPHSPALRPDPVRYDWSKEQIRSILKPQMTWRDYHHRDFAFEELWTANDYRSHIPEEKYYKALLQHMTAIARLFNYTSTKQAFIAMLYFLEHNEEIRAMWDDLEVVMFSDDLEAKRDAARGLENYFWIKEIELENEPNPHT